MTKDIKKEAKKKRVKPFEGNGCDINLISLGDHDGIDLRKENIKKNKHIFIYEIAIASIEVFDTYTVNVIEYSSIKENAFQMYNKSLLYGCVIYVCANQFIQLNDFNLLCI